MPAAYFFGRPLTTLDPDARSVDRALFAATLLDGAELQRAQYSHCTFANISFKEVTVAHCTFVNCVFVRCYFRKSQLRSSVFTACKFIDCEFPNASVQGCTWQYVSFQGCFIAPLELRHSLPPEPNLRRDLTANLAREAEVLGSPEDARIYRLWSIDAQERHLAAAWRNEGEWYRTHYVGLRRVRAFARYATSRVDGFLWGHGERIWVLTRNLLLAVFLIFPALFYWLRDGLAVLPVAGRAANESAGIADVLLHSIDNVLPAAGITSVTPATTTTRVLTAVEVFLGLLAAGLLVAYAFRAISRRSLRRF